MRTTSSLPAYSASTYLERSWRGYALLWMPSCGRRLYRAAISIARLDTLTMNRSTFRSGLFAAASALAAVLPLSLAGAQSLDTPVRSAEQVRAAYVAQGYEVSAPTFWSWTNRSTTFTVQDQLDLNDPSGAVLMVIVYPDMEAAEAARRDGARPAPGYGPSVWQDNVALVQSTRSGWRGVLAKR
jgi:hypothetical protein